MQSILQLLDESNLINNDILTNEQVVEVYKATTKEEREKYMKTIENFLDGDTISDLQQAVSYINLEAFIYKNGLIQ